MISALINRPCELRQKASTDEGDFGAPRSAGDDAVETLCALDGVSTSESAGEGEAATGNYIAFFLPEEILDTSTALVLDGKVYEFAGVPDTIFDPEVKADSHIEVPVRFTGAVEDGDEEGS